MVSMHTSVMIGDIPLTRLRSIARLTVMGILEQESRNYRMDVLLMWFVNTTVLFIHHGKEKRSSCFLLIAARVGVLLMLLPKAQVANLT